MTSLDHLGRSMRGYPRKHKLFTLHERTDEGQGERKMDDKIKTKFKKKGALTSLIKISEFVV